MPLLRAAATWVVSKVFNIDLSSLPNFPPNWDEMTDAEQTAWFRERAGTAGGGSNNPDGIPPAVGNVDDGRTGTTGTTGTADPTSQVSSGLGSLFVGQDGKAVYTSDGQLVGNQGTGGPMFDLDSDGDGVPDGYFYNSYSEGQSTTSLSWQPATDGSGQGVFNYTDPETGAGTLLNPGQKIPGTGYGADARFAPVGPDGEDYGFYDSEGRALYDEFGRTIDPETGKVDDQMGAAIRNMDTSNLDPLRQYSATRPNDPKNINPMSQYGLRFQDPNAPKDTGSVPKAPEPYVPPVYDPVFPEYATNPGGTPISPVAPQANPFLTQPSSIDYGYGDDNMPPGFKSTSTGMVTQQLVSYINPKTGDKWTASNGGNYDMPEGWEVDKTGQMQDDGTGFQYQPPKASVQPVNAMAPPPVSPFATPVAPPVQANPFQGGIGSFVQQPEVAQPVEPVEQPVQQPVSNNLFGGG